MYRPACDADFLHMNFLLLRPSFLVSFIVEIELWLFFVWQVTEDEVLEVMEKILVNNNSSGTTKQYAITAVVKLSTRFNSSLP